MQFETNNAAINNRGIEQIQQVVPGMAIAKAMTILFAPPSIGFFMPLGRTNRNMKFSLDNESISFSQQSEDITSENAGSIKAIGMVHHLRKIGSHHSS